MHVIESKENIMKKVLIVAFSVFTLSANANFMESTHNWNKGSSVDPFAAAIAAAESGYATNLKANMAWRDTGKMINEAKKLHKAGKLDAAVALANKAHKQTANAASQHKLATIAGPRF